MPAIFAFIIAIGLGLWVWSDVSAKNAETELFKTTCWQNGGKFTPMPNPDDNYCDLPKRDRD